MVRERDKPGFTAPSNREDQQRIAKNAPRPQEDEGEGWGDDDDDILPE